jgi:hypothetical protein
MWLEELKSLWHYAYDGVLLSVEEKLASQDIRLAAITTLP